MRNWSEKKLSQKEEKNDPDRKSIGKKSKKQKKKYDTRWHMMIRTLSRSGAARTHWQRQESTRSLPPQQIEVILSTPPPSSPSTIITITTIIITIHEEPATAAANRGHFSSLGDAFLIFKKNLIYLPILLVLLSDQMNFTKMALIKSNINQNFWRHLVVKICIKSMSRHLRAKNAMIF